MDTIRNNLDSRKGSKGSKYQIQHYINLKAVEFNQLLLTASPSLPHFLDKDLMIKWKSPLFDDGYKEYRNDFLDLVDEWKGKKILLNQYWTKTGPQWDGIAILTGKSGLKGLMLVEAKAHPNEMISKLKSDDKDNKALIERTLRDTQKFFGSQASLEIWRDQYYQLANRLAYLYILNEKLGIPTWLALVNFVNDHTYKPTSVGTWIKHNQEVFIKMDLRFSESILYDKLIMIYPQGVKS